MVVAKRMEPRRASHGGCRHGDGHGHDGGRDGDGHGDGRARRLADPPANAAAADLIATAGDAVNTAYRWPIITGALNWLQAQAILGAADQAALIEQAEEEAEAGGIEISSRLQSSFTRLLTAGAAASLSNEDMTALAVQQAEATRANAETIARTYSHRAYNAGMREVMSSPATTGEFPYLLYKATRDTRSRPTHIAMDGRVAHVDSPLAGEMLALADEWNCRCVVIPITRAEALRRGIDDNTGWREPDEPLSPPRIDFT